MENALKGLPTDDASWKAKYFRVWRLWPERCAREMNPFLAYLVADTRIPDHTLWIDCDVMDADGGTRTASITGAFIAAVDAIAKSPFADQLKRFFVDSVAAISVGVIEGEVMVDLDYKEDSQADVDMNLVMTGSGKFIEVQGTGERTPFTSESLKEMIEFGSDGIRRLTDLQRVCLGELWPVD